jgi:hypothetical protein
VKVNAARIGSGRVGGRFVLYDVRSERYVVLYDHAERVWKEILGGTTKITELVRRHARAHRVPVEVASFEVISFLDELRALGLVEFSLPQERETAPLIDTPIGPEDLRARHLVELISGRPPFERAPTPATELIVLREPRGDLTLARLAEIEPRKSQGRHGRRTVVVARDPPAGWRVRDILALEPVASAGAARSATLVHLLAPSPDLTIDELADLARGRSAIDEARRGRLTLVEPVDPETAVEPPAGSGRLVIVIIVDGVVIIIVIDGGGTGSGKSRQSCKTMCV